MKSRSAGWSGLRKNPEDNQVKESKHQVKRNILMVLLGVIILGGIAFATTTINDNGVTTGLISSDNISIKNTTITGKATITNIDAGNALVIDQNGASPTSTSTGGALLMEMTGNTGAGLIIYSNNAAPTGRLVNIRADNAAFSQAALHIDYDGTANGVEVVHNNNDSSSEAMDITSYNEQDTTLGLSGMQTARGVLKITHNKPSSDDSSSSALSIVVSGTGSKAQGVYIDGTASNTTGSLLVVKNHGQQLFIVDSNGTLQLTGNVTEIPTCGAAQEGDIYYNKGLKGHYACNLTGWHRLY